MPAAQERCLADLHVMEEARIWGETLARYLHHCMRGGLRWEDVDCGVLLSGPTGVGKTMFAGALARTCGCPLVSASLGEWQAAGPLGDLLKAMRRTFDEARKRSEEHTSELQSLMRISYAAFCLKKKNNSIHQ